MNPNDFPLKPWLLTPQQWSYFLLWWASDLISWNISSVFLKISSVFLSTFLLPFCFRTQRVSITFEISDCILPSIFCQLLLQSLHSLHLFSPFCCFLSFALKIPLIYLSSIHSTHTRSPPCFLSETVFWKFTCCVFLSLNLMVSLITYLSSLSLLPFPHPCFWKLMKAFSPSVWASYHSPPFH